MHSPRSSGTPPVEFRRGLVPPRGTRASAFLAGNGPRIGPSKSGVRSVGEFRSVVAFRGVAWREVASAWGATPKSTLLGVFQITRRAARKQMLQRISERLVDLASRRGA
jgi:hypothetical protein